MSTKPLKRPKPTMFESVSQYFPTSSLWYVAPNPFSPDEDLNLKMGHKNINMVLSVPKDLDTVVFSSHYSDRFVGEQQQRCM